MGNKRKGKKPRGGEPSQSEPKREDEEIKVVKIEFDKIKDYIKPANKIGKGAFGSVYKGTFEEREVAIKVSHNKKVLSCKQWENEINHLSNLRHENIINLVATGESEKGFFSIFEYMPQSLGDVYKELSWPHTQDIIVQVAQALHCLHDSEPPLAHGDLKLENILLDKDGRAKLCDFGTTQKDNSYEIMGTRGYTAPELRSRDLRAGCLPKVTRASDIYSFGICILKLMLEETDFEDSEHKGQKGKGKGKGKGKETDKTIADNIKDRQKQNLLSSKLPRPGSNSTENFNKMIELGLSCAQHKAAERPHIARVLQTLETIK